MDATLSNPPVGMSFVPGGTTVTVNQSGVYRIDYRVHTTAGIGTALRLLINGVPLANSDLFLLLDIGQRSGVADVSLNAGDTVAIGTSGFSILLASGTNAFLELIKIA